MAPRSWEMPRAGPGDAQSDVAPASTHSLPLLLGTAPAFPPLPAFPTVPALGGTGDVPFFPPVLPLFVPRAAGDHLPGSWGCSG